MKRPPSSALKRARKTAGLTLEQVTERLEIDISTLSRLESGRTRLTAERARELAAIYGVSATDLLEDTLPPEGVRLVRMSVLGAVQAGVWREAAEWPDDDRYTVTIPESKRFPGVPRHGLEVRGDSMNQVYPHGTVLECVSVVDTRLPRSGERVVVHRVRGDGLVEATVKEYVEADGKLWLVPRSSNPQFQQPIELPAMRTDDYHPPHDGVAHASDLADDDVAEIAITSLVIGSYRPE